MSQQQTIVSDDSPEIGQQLPIESITEYERFMFYKNTPKPHSVRRAYIDWCKANDREPAHDAPRSWYVLAEGKTAMLLQAEKQAAAIEAAEIIGRIPDWEGLEATAREIGDLGKYPGNYSEIMDEITMIDYAFHSLAIDLQGRPLPDVLPWAERAAAYWKSAV